MVMCHSFFVNVYQRVISEVSKISKIPLKSTLDSLVFIHPSGAGCMTMERIPGPLIFPRRSWKLPRKHPKNKMKTSWIHMNLLKHRSMCMASELTKDQCMEMSITW